MGEIYVEGNSSKKWASLQPKCLIKEKCVGLVCNPQDYDDYLNKQLNCLCGLGKVVLGHAQQPVPRHERAGDGGDDLEPQVVSSPQLPLIGAHVAV